jgi:OHCU decarboxylase
MVARRPFGSYAALVTAADEVWAGATRDDWREAFAAHPRIGDRSGPEHTRREQAGTAGAGAATLDALAEGNRAYEQRFGHVFLINAAGRSAGEMLSALRSRLTNDPDTEVGVAAEQQRQITRLRLDRLMRPSEDSR